MAVWISFNRDGRLTFPSCQTGASVCFEIPQNASTVCNVVGSHQIVRVSILDAILLPRRVGLIPGCSCTSIRVCYDAELVRFVPAYEARSSREQTIPVANAFA